MGQGFIGGELGTPFCEINGGQQIDIGKRKRVAREEGTVRQCLVDDFQPGDEASAPTLDQLRKLALGDAEDDVLGDNARRVFPRLAALEA